MSRSDGDARDAAAKAGSRLALGDMDDGDWVRCVRALRVIASGRCPSPSLRFWVALLIADGYLDWNGDVLSLSERGRREVDPLRAEP